MTKWIILGFIVYFLLIGRLVYIRTEKSKYQGMLNKQKLLLWCLYGFTPCYLFLLSKVALQDEISFTVEVVSLFLFTTFLVNLTCFFCLKLRNRKKTKLGNQAEVAESNQAGAKDRDQTDVAEDAKRESTAHITLPAFTRKDFLWMTAITLLGAIIIFFRLGSMQAPQNALTLKVEGNKNEIVLNFGEPTYINEAYLFLGHMDTRILSISYFDEAKNEWVLITDDIEVESVYTWNQMKIGKKIKYLGIVSRNGEAIYNELVFLDKDNNQLLPINREEYAPLFDEQDRFPKDMTYYYGTMFDEIYYARSAYEFLNGMEMFEVTHPPLGKILIAIGVAIFGVTPFGWRVVCAVAGVLILPVIYLFVYRLSGKTRYATFATAFVALDFMHLTLSRIATLDSIVALFILAVFCSVYYLLTQIRYQVENKFYRVGAKLWISVLIGSLMTGAAIATKWTGFYAAFGVYLFFMVDMLYLMRKYRHDKEVKCFLRKLFWGTQFSFILLAALVYLLSYLPMSQVNGTNLVKTMWKNSIFMLSFHGEIVFDHPYSSAWYTWILDLVPLVDSGTMISDSDKVSLVATMGNPILWWGGFAAFVFLLYRACFKRDRKAIYLSGAYLAMLVPWFFIIRTVFIYQYYTCALLLCCMLSYALSFLEQKWKSAGYVVLEAALLCGIIFFPILTGFAFNSASVAVFLQWLDRWKFV